MKNYSRNHDLVEKYLEGKLTTNEEDLFQKSLSDSSFRWELLTQARIIDAANKLDFEDTKTELEVKKKKPQVFTYLISISVILIVMITSFKFLKTQSQNVQMANLTEEYFIPYPATGIGRGEQDQNQLDLAIQAYGLEDYEKAREKFNLIEEENAVSIIYLANIYLIEKKYQQSRSLLENHSDFNNKLMNHNREWYLCLSYLSIGEKIRALELLDEIVKHPNHLYYSDALSLAQKLQK